MPVENDKSGRLAAALRANLARRKAQSRGRKAAEAQDARPDTPLPPDGAAGGRPDRSTPGTPQDASAGSAGRPAGDLPIVPGDKPG